MSKGKQLESETNSNADDEHRIKICLTQSLARIVDGASRAKNNAPDEPFSLFSTMSAPGHDALDSQGGIQRLGSTVAPKLKSLCLATGEALEPDMAALICWSCYREAIPKGMLLDQRETPTAYLGLRRALSAWRNSYWRRFPSWSHSGRSSTG